MKYSKKFSVSLLALLLTSTTLVGCQNNTTTQNTSVTNTQTHLTDTTSKSEVITSTTNIDTTFSERDKDFNYDQETATQVTLNKNEMSISGNGASVSGNVLTISSEGTYVLSGTLENGQIIVDAPETAKVQIVLNGVAIHSENHAPIYIKQADKVFLTLKEGAENTISDGTTYNLSENDNNVDATIFSKADLTINGNGTLAVISNYKHGIVSKDDLVVTGGTITVNANGQGLYGKDRMKIADGTFTLVTKGDAIQSDNAEDATKGYIYISSGTFNITSEADGLQAETVLRIDGGTFDISTGGGSANASTYTQDNAPRDKPHKETNTTNESNDATTSISSKALKAGTELIINDGKFTIDSLEDSLHSNDSLAINNGNLTLLSGDDGIHAESAVTIHDGVILISKSYEGIEGSSITINGGDISVTSRDDGFNAADDSSPSFMPGGPAQDTSKVDSDVFILIAGGNININASGDGIDSNGDISIVGGTVLVNGPTDNGNSSLDYDGNASIGGGVLMMAGSSRMAENFSSSSTQCTLLYNWPTELNAGTAITLSDANGKELVSFTPSKTFQSVLISSPSLTEGATYTLSAGEETVEVTLSSTINSLGVSGGKGPGGMNGGKPPKGEPGSIRPEGIPDSIDGSQPPKGEPGSIPPQDEPGSTGGSQTQKGDKSGTTSNTP